MNRSARIALASFVGVIAAVTIPIGGRPLLGFSYRSVENNEWTICPDWVIAQTGNDIALNTGERFRVCDQVPEDLTRVLLLSNALVKIDRPNKTMLIRRRAASCGNRPEQGQWLTIPLHAAEVSQTYFAEEFARVEPLPSTTNPAN